MKHQVLRQYFTTTHLGLRLHEASLASSICYTTTLQGVGRGGLHQPPAAPFATPLHLVQKNRAF